MVSGFNNKIIISFVFLFIVSIVFPVFAEEMSSANYKIQADSVNVFGKLSTTSSYKLEDTGGELATGVFDSSSYKLNAGYQQMHEVYISLSAISDINMSPNIKTSSGGASNGSGGATVVTDSASGYFLSVKASVSPALFSASDSFTDYTPSVTGTPDFSWSVLSSVSEFGFSVEGANIVQKFKDNGLACNAGIGDVASSCWYGLSTSNEVVALSYSANNPLGASTTVRFRAESGSSHTQAVGDYQAVITFTALPN